MVLDNKSLTNLLLHLIELDKSLQQERLKKELEEVSGEKAVDDFLNGLLHRVIKFREMRDQVREDFASLPVITIKDSKAKQMLRKISEGEKFRADAILQTFTEVQGKRIGEDIIDKDRLEEIAWGDILFSWWSPYGYIEDLIQIGVLVIGIPVPKTLERFVSEARECYAFQQYNAVYSLCRTIIETAMKEVALQSGKIRRLRDDKEFYLEYPPHTLINKVSRDHRQKRLHDLYDEISSLIHGNKTINKKVAESTLKETLELAEYLYEHNL